MFNNREKKLFADSNEAYVEHSNLKYLHRLNFYDRPPLYDVTIEEFETCALDRLRILAEIESSAVRNRSWEETRNITQGLCKKYLPLNANSATSVDRDAERRSDNLSHFVLRLAFCRSEELRRRFVKAETTLFKVRYDTDDVKERRAFLGSRNFNWTPVDEKEKTELKEQLMNVSIPFSKDTDRHKSFTNEHFYKVRWTRVPDLVEKRKVLLKGGWAYVPGREQSSIIFREFEIHLEKALEMTAKALPRLDEDTRLVPILNNLSQGFLAGVPSEWNGKSEGTGDEIKADMVDELARSHFPICMRSMHDTLRKDRKLLHFGRLNYGLFLKVLGLSIEEAIVFWRKSFSKITDDEFNKKYKYNIRHAYGLEGKRANYPAKSCQQLLAPGGDSSHGCPYRQFSPDNLQTALLSAYSSQGLTAGDLPEIMNDVKGGHFHIACTRVFEITHSRYGVKKGEGVGGGECITHPNQYVAKSMELKKASAKTESEVPIDLDG